MPNLLPLALRVAEINVFKQTKKAKSGGKTLQSIYKNINNKLATFSVTSKSATIILSHDCTYILYPHPPVRSVFRLHAVYRFTTYSLTFYQRANWSALLCVNLRKRFLSDAKMRKIVKM